MTALAGYREAHDFAIADPEGYWAQQLQLVDWIKAPTVILETAVPSTIEDPAVLERLRPVLHRQ